MLDADSAWAALAFGWWRVIARAAPRIEVDSAGVAVGAVSGLLVFVMLHWFASWIYTETRARQQRDDWPQNWRCRWTLCIIGSVVLAFVSGLVGVGLFRTVGWFVANELIVRG